MSFNDNQSYWELRYRKEGGKRTVGWKGIDDDSYDKIISEFSSIVRPFVGTPKRILDFGCGIGRWRPSLELFGDYYACDLIEQEGFERFDVVRNGVIPFDGISFDLIWTCVTLQHIVDDRLLRSLACQLSRRLTPEGTIIMTENVCGEKDLDYLKFRSEKEYISLFPELNVSRVGSYDFLIGQDHAIMKGIKEKVCYVVTLIGGIGNIIQTIPFMKWLKDCGYEVVGRVSKDADSSEICEMAAASCDSLIGPDEIVSGAIDKGSLLASKEGKRLVSEMSEWQAWFVWHGFDPPIIPKMEIDIQEYKCPSRVVFAPCCKPEWPMKQWPHWNELIFKMPGCTVVGLPGDGGELKGEFVDLRGKLSLKELAGVLADAEYVVAQECGVAHLSCAVGSRTYILYGGTDPIKNAPPDNAVMVMSSEKFACRPCQYRSWYVEYGGKELIHHGCHPRDCHSGFSRCMIALTTYELQKAIADNGDDCLHCNFRRL